MMNPSVSNKSQRFVICDPREWQMMARLAKSEVVQPEDERMEERLVLMARSISYGVTVSDL